jgi:benzoylformate decarboxylase
MIVNQAVTMGNYILGLGELRAGGHAMTSSTYMGWAAGAPLGMKLAAPKRAVLSCLGDGGLIFGAQALWTAARYGIPVVYCVFDNSAYMAIKSSLVDRDGAARRAGAFPGSELHGPSVDLVKLAESFGVAARRVDRAGDVRGALEWALGAGGPVVLDFVIDRAELGAHRAAPAAEKARA